MSVSPRQDPTQFRPGTVLNDRYEILRPIGMGGYAIVYEGFDKQIERIVAIKTLHNTLTHHHDPLERFKREAKAAGRIEHPNIVTVYDTAIVKETGQPIIVMEYLDGRNLYEELDLFGPMEPERALPLFCAALDALAEGHRQGVIHRDLKPANLFLLTHENGEEDIRVLDFGGAFMDEWAMKLTREGSLFGTIQYMPPEYIRREFISPALDVYQMGLILIEMLTARPVVTGDPKLAHVKHLNQTLPIPNHLLYGPLGTIIRKALAEDPEVRYHNAEAFLQDVSIIVPSSIPPLETGPIRSTLLSDYIRGAISENHPNMGGLNAQAHTENLGASQVMDLDSDEARTTLYKAKRAHDSGVVYMPVSDEDDDDIPIDERPAAVADFSNGVVVIPPSDSGHAVTDSQILTEFNSSFALMQASQKATPLKPKSSEAYPPIWKFSGAVWIGGVIVLFLVVHMTLSMFVEDNLTYETSAYVAAQPVSEAPNEDSSKLEAMEKVPPKIRPHIIRATPTKHDNNTVIGGEQLKSMVLVQIETQPSNASLHRGDEDLGSDPVIIAFNDTHAEPVKIIARHDAFPEHTQVISPNGPKEVTITLKPGVWLQRKRFEKRKKKNANNPRDAKRTGKELIAD